MSYSEYARGVQDERFANQLQIQRLSRSVAEWTAYARRKEAEAARLKSSLDQVRAELASLSNPQRDGVGLMAALTAKLAASEKALIDEREHAAGRVQALELDLEHLKCECDWMKSVVTDPLNKGFWR